MATPHRHELLRPIIKRMNAAETIEEFEFIGVENDVEMSTWIHWHHQEEARIRERNEAIANHLLWGEPWVKDDRRSSYLLS